MSKVLRPLTPEHLGSQVPRRGHWLLAGLGRFILRSMGWRIVGELPNVERAVLVVAPHTSNVDGLIGISAIQSLRVHVRFMGKDALFKGVLGPVMRWLGGIPVRRESAHDMVEQTVQAMTDASFWLGIAPEGTRKSAPRFKTGFYHIAERAGVPIVALGFCYQRREVRIVDTFLPSGNQEKDIARILAALSDIQPRHPHWLSQPLRELKRPRS